MVLRKLFFYLNTSLSKIACFNPTVVSTIVFSTKHCLTQQWFDPIVVSNICFHSYVDQSWSTDVSTTILFSPE
ncbi:hypothetical protein Hanom_Chr11g01035541 [Helianthus anomalus]